MHSEITRYETQRESLAQELVLITSQVENLQSQVQDYQSLKDQYTDMEQKYNALLQVCITCVIDLCVTKPSSCTLGGIF